MTKNGHETLTLNIHGVFHNDIILKNLQSNHRDLYNFTSDCCVEVRAQRYMADERTPTNSTSPFHAINLLCSNLKKPPKYQKKGKQSGALQSIKRVLKGKVNMRSGKDNGRDDTRVPSGLLAATADARREGRTIFRDSTPNRLHEDIVLDETGHLVYYSAIGSYQLNVANITEDIPKNGRPHKDLGGSNPHEYTGMQEVHARTGARSRQGIVDVYGDLQYSDEVHTLQTGNRLHADVEVAGRVPHYEEEYQPRSSTPGNEQQKEIEHLGTVEKAYDFRSNFARNDQKIIHEQSTIQHESDAGQLGLITHTNINSQTESLRNSKSLNDLGEVQVKNLEKRQRLITYNTIEVQTEGITNEIHREERREIDEIEKNHEKEEQQQQVTQREVTVSPTQRAESREANSNTETNMQQGEVRLEELQYKNTANQSNNEQAAEGGQNLSKNIQDKKDGPRHETSEESSMEYYHENRDKHWNRNQGPRFAKQKNQEEKEKPKEQREESPTQYTRYVLEKITAPKWNRQD